MPTLSASEARASLYRLMEKTYWVQMESVPDEAAL